MTDIQKVILDIYKEIKRICDAEDIPFYAIGGTALGAVRHKGFIPWDDDIDIVVPIEHWDRFLTACRDHLPSNLYLYRPDEIKYYANTFIKVCDKNTTVFEDADLMEGMKSAWKGVWVDVMPISGVPEKKWPRKLFIWALRQCYMNNAHLRLFPTESHTWKSKIGRLPFRALAAVLPFDFFHKLTMKLLRRYPMSESKWTGCVWQTESLSRYNFPNWFNEAVELPFEDTRMRMPRKWDEFLTFQFGDYMTPVCTDADIHVAYYNLDRPFTDFKDYTTEELKALSVKKQK